MPFKIVRNNITKMEVDIIVNSANPNPVIGGGVDCEIHIDLEFDYTIGKIDMDVYY